MNISVRTTFLNLNHHKSDVVQNQTEVNHHKVYHLAKRQFFTDPRQVVPRFHQRGCYYKNSILIILIIQFSKYTSGIYLKSYLKYICYRSRNELWTRPRNRERACYSAPFWNHRRRTSRAECSSRNFHYLQSSNHFNL